MAVAGATARARRRTAPAAQRRAIAKAITLLESTRADHRARADALLTALLPHTGKSFRLGISGVPGVGKSHLHRGARPAPDRAGPSRRGARGRSVVERLGRLDPRRQDAHGAALGARAAPSSGRARPAARSAAWPTKTREAMLVVRGGRLRRRDRRDRRRRPERDRGRRHDRHVRAAAAAQRRRRPAGDQEGRDGAGRPGRRSTRPTSTRPPRRARRRRSRRRCACVHARAATRAASEAAHGAAGAAS